MSHLDDANKYGIPARSRSHSVRKNLDPIERLRWNFTEVAGRQLANVKDDVPLGRNGWVTKEALGDGRVQYSVRLKVGPKLIIQPGEITCRVMTSKEDVVAYLKKITASCEAGELDGMLAETAGLKVSAAEHSEVITPSAVPETVE
jgi:hypothetical protein